MNSYPWKAIKSKYILKIILDNISKKKFFNIIRYNKLLKELLDININDYKTYYEKIEIELIPLNKKDKKDKISFINIKEKYKSYYHIYFNNDKNEIKQTYYTKNDNIKKIKIIIDKEIKNFEDLFYDCSDIEKITFINFNKNNINNMISMFSGCSSLKELNLNNFNTTNVTNMNGMFFGCSSLKELNLNKFNTSNVNDMNGMFFGCSSLKDLNLNNFNTKNVTDMRYMFSGCSEDLKQKIKSEYKNIKNEAFTDTI